MHIAFFMQDTGVIYGAERATLDLAAALHGFGDVRVKVYLIKEIRLTLLRSALREAFAAQNIPVENIPVRRAFSWSLIKTLRERMDADGIDVLHTVGYKADLHGGIATSFGRKRPIVGTVHGWLFRAELKERFYGWLNIQALRRFTRVVVLSRYYERYMADKGIASDALIRIPSGYPAPSGLDSRTGSDTFTVGMMGRLSGEKNHAMLLRAAKELHRMNVAVRFVIAGDGPERGRILEAVQSENLSSIVELRGYMAMPDFFREVDVLAMCSRIENLPYSLLEGMAAGVPAVATNVGGVPDLIEDGVNGFLVDADDAPAMASCLGLLSEDAALVRRMAEAGLEKLRREFSPERHRDEHIRMYQALLKRRGD